MTTLQVRNSLFTNSSIETIVKSYPISNITECSFLTRGLNDSYLIRTREKKYIFRFYRMGWREKSDILYELDAINYLAEQGIQVSKPIMRTDGKWLTEIHAPEGTRYGVLFTFSKGDRPEINDENCFLIGKALATIHKSTDSFHSNHRRSFELDFDHLVEEPMKLITPTLSKYINIEKSSFLNELLNTIKTDINNNNLNYGFCHGDFHNFNMHIENKNIEAFDFDCSSIGFRSYDLAVFWWNLKQNYSSLEQPCWEKFLNGYLSVNTLGSPDIKLLGKFVTLRRIWFMGILIKNDDVFGTHWQNQNNFEHFLSQIENTWEVD